ncbi:MAG TPA: ComF family protein [Longimicrobiaceae bacterium]|nr:ComF family protein [Longimicrobiaceae bacterium]
MSLLARAADLRDGLLDLVFAPVCAACAAPVPTTRAERLVCGLCWSRVREVPGPRCDRCWTPLPPAREPGPRCAACAALPAGVRAVRSAFVMGETARKLVHALKYRGWAALAEPLGARMAALPFPWDAEEEARLVVPVPTSPTRVRERGYNQAALLARAFAARTGRTTDPEMLARTRASRTQTALHPEERRANVAGAFAVPERRRSALRGEHVLLVDDVWTTGATAVACAQALLDAGARVVSVATFARAIPELERWRGAGGG